ncbi:NAD(P)/FAD-dependent oxidoreductase [Luteipulveratus sp. YIM 133132]|uniref:phytoene desaturase family protein n=1 Tax=Luteipulveratus flavus TaxID=3031728 RepID=UPI0023B067F2|nr:NAD(P)/FAD-dependent oxidoreductase [Luteipulveratus sp. YIM 133132]MDE9367555.1 NAD(P)/FAD-dependent oxidoreductase [Luteipulveratus sp. YIM 133132]
MSSSPDRTSYDVVIVGGGHNGLTAAAYLARAGRSVLLLERQDHLGGAAVSAEAFEGMGARLSRYSYLVSLLPRQIIDDLGLRITLRRRRYASYTPRPGTDTGLLVDNQDVAATRESFRAVGAGQDADAFAELYERTGRLAEALWPTVTEPLARRSELRSRVDDSIWHDLVERPLGEMIEARLQDDLVRGVVLTDGLISTFARAHQPDLQQNICFLYHVIGRGTGAWDVPVGGMGEVSGALERAAREAGARLRTGSTVSAIDPDGTVSYADADGEYTVRGEYVLCGAAPQVLAGLLGSQTSGPAAEGAQVKVNLLLSRLPRLREAGVDPTAAFGGTFHINELYTQLEDAYATAAGGQVPAPVPAEIYCHSLTDPSILSPQLHASGAQTLTVFSLQTPHRLLDAATHDAQREALEKAVLDSLTSVLAEPIDDVVMRRPDGTPCVETKTTLDLERTLGMSGGSIFHGPLDWPFAEDDEPLDTPARRWGVATAHDRVLVCGAGSRRGGGVSGLGGYHAARAVLEADRS